MRRQTKAAIVSEGVLLPSPHSVFVPLQAYTNWTSFILIYYHRDRYLVVQVFISFDLILHYFASETSWSTTPTIHSFSYLLRWVQGYAPKDYISYYETLNSCLAGLLDRQWCRTMPVPSQSSLPSSSSFTQTLYLLADISRQSCEQKPAAISNRAKIRRVFPSKPNQACRQRFSKRLIFVS